MISLSHDDFRLEVVPQLGAAIAAFTYRRSDVLRPMRPGSDDPLETSSFVLAPFANRIADGAFRFEEREIRLPRNMAGQKHPLHGHAWRKPWTVLAQSPRQVELEYQHEPDEWPWSYRVVQRLMLTESGLHSELILRNEDARAMPAGLGWHPYFHGRPAARLRTHVQGRWEIDEDMLPTTHTADGDSARWSEGCQLNGKTLIDHCHTGWSGRAWIELPESGLRVTVSASSSLRWLHLYVPPAESFFCVEPVSHMPNAVNRSEPLALTGLTVLAPGSSLSAWMNISARDLRTDGHRSGSAA
jgi:aldose 1-epimerase